jgi:membrane protein DedA with SNARE-associated domain/rhodanese-related sulfurtransferase
MNQILEFLSRHGVLVLYAAVFVEQLGIPLPAAPWLLAAGALCGAGQMNWWSVLAAAAAGSVCADAIWFYLGRYRGNRILNLLCRISLEPDSCVRRTQDVFGRYGMKAVVVAKFVPGLSILAPPLAGSSGAKASRFFLFDMAGSLLYAGVFILIGVLFSHQLEQILAALAGLGNRALALVVTLAALYIGFKYYQRRRLLKELRMARITVDELHEKLKQGETPIILDLRSLTELDRDPTLILGARHVSVQDLKSHLPEIPRDRDVILYCSCPNEESSARMALLFHRYGLSRVRPLLGGIDAWRERNYPTEARATVEMLAIAEPGKEQENLLKRETNSKI